MAKLAVLFIALSLCAFASAFQFTTEDQDVDANINPIAKIFSQSFVNALSRLLTSLAEHLKLKLRVARFLTSQYTEENLLLLRDLIGQGIKLGNFALRVLPQSIDDPGYSWILAFTQLFNNLGSSSVGGVLDLIAGPAVDNGATQPSGSISPEAALAEVSSQSASDPPVFYNARVNRETRNVANNNLYVNEFQPQESANLIGQYHERITALDKLINARRR